MILDVGCGYLSDHKRREGVGLDLQRGTCDVVGDVQCLPFRDDVFGFVYARNILEHLDDPLRALRELRRVMRSNGKISIAFPIHHNLCVDEMSKLLAGFPLRLYRSVKRLVRWRRNKGNIGFLHKNNVKPKHIARFFVMLKVEHIYSIHPFNKPINFLLKILFGVTTPIYYPFPYDFHILAKKLGDKP